MLFAWLGYLVTSASPNIDVRVFRSTLVLHSLYGAGAAAYLAYLVLRRRLPGPTRLDWPIAALMLVYGAAVAQSIYPRLSLETALFAGVIIVAFYALSDLPFLTVETAIRGLVAVGAAAAAYALYQVGADYARWLDLVQDVEGKVRLATLFPPTVPRVHNVGDHVNVLAMALNLALPFAACLALRARRRLERPLAILAALIILIALFFTLSRGAWAGAAVALPLLTALVVFRNRRVQSVQLPRMPVPLVAATLVLALLVAAGFTALIATRWDSRPAWLFRSSL